MSPFRYKAIRDSGIPRPDGAIICPRTGQCIHPANNSKRHAKRASGARQLKRLIRDNRRGA